MLELLKKAEEGVKNFNNLPEEQRYYYDPGDKFAIHVTGLERVDIDHTVRYKFKGHEIGNKYHWWFNYFYDTFEFVTKEEAFKRAEKDKANQKREIEKLEYEIEHLQQKLTDLKEECNKDEDTNCKA